MAQSFDLMVAPTGARLRKADHPGVPITAAEIAESAVRCEEAGANAIHVHVRDAAGRHSLDPARYGTAIEAIRQRSAMHIQVSTEAAGMFDVAAQRDCLAKVEARDASVALREVSRDPGTRSGIFAAAAARGISVQHILYSPQEVTELLRLQDQAALPPGKLRVIFVLGRYADGPASRPSDIEPFRAAMGETAMEWSVCAFGAAEGDCLMAALGHGGNARIGFENNRTGPDGRPFADNAASVAAFVARADRAGFTPRRVCP